jgi:hypothetical protein
MKIKNILCRERGYWVIKHNLIKFILYTYKIYISFRYCKFESCSRWVYANHVTGGLMRKCEVYFTYMYNLSLAYCKFESCNRWVNTYMYEYTAVNLRHWPKTDSFT